MLLWAIAPPLCSVKSFESVSSAANVCCGLWRTSVVTDVCKPQNPDLLERRPMLWWRQHMKLVWAEKWDQYWQMRCYVIFGNCFCLANEPHDSDSLSLSGHLRTIAADRLEDYRCGRCHRYRHYSRETVVVLIRDVSLPFLHCCTWDAVQGWSAAVNVVIGY